MDIGHFKGHNQDDEDEAWAAWLADDSVKQQPKPARGPMKPGRQFSDMTSSKVPGLAPKTQNRAPSSTFTQRRPRIAEKPQSEHQSAVSIQIRIPAFHLPKIHIPWQATRPWLLGIVGLVLVIFGGKFVIDHLPKHKAKQQSIPVSAQASADLGYRPLVPAARAEGAVTPSRPVYNSQKKLYTFNDQYKGANLTVDQQAIPDKLKENEKEVVKLAESLGAKDSFTTTQGKVYIFTSKTSGAQRLILANDKLLMFIQSTHEVDVASWVQYIQALQ